MYRDIKAELRQIEREAEREQVRRQNMKDGILFGFVFFGFVMMVAQACMGVIG